MAELFRKLRSDVHSNHIGPFIVIINHQKQIFLRQFSSNVMTALYGYFHQRSRSRPKRWGEVHTGKIRLQKKNQKQINRHFDNVYGHSSFCKIFITPPKVAGM